jgi:hypothetical protein
MEQVTGETPDMSEYLDFGFYDWVWFKDNTVLGENCIGHGLAWHIASETSCCIRC